MPAWVAKEIDAFVTELGGSGRVLEIGSGGGRDALALEACGISVRRTDVSNGFVQLLRQRGFEADLLDPLTDDLADPQCPGTAYDGVWACACLIHVAREDLGRVLGRLAEWTRTGGPLHVSVREGDGEDASTCGQRCGASALRRDVLARARPAVRAHGRWLDCQRSASVHRKAQRSLVERSSASSVIRMPAAAAGRLLA
jgi:SAM-dependent methyltransferase